jgi:acyl-CoA synthetase (AMP-forming)/AMP-acid ligase II
LYARREPDDQFSIAKDRDVCIVRREDELPLALLVLHGRHHPISDEAVVEVVFRLVDDERNELADDPEAIGEVCVRGPNVFAGYLNRDDATRAVLEDGWFFTGDLAQRVDGQIRIVGRRSTDIIKCGGFKVGAGEVEAALLEHPDIAEAAVIGEPDPDLGERIVAFVVVRKPVEAKAIENHVAVDANSTNWPNWKMLAATQASGPADPRQAISKPIRLKYSANR